MDRKFEASNPRMNVTSPITIFALASGVGQAGVAVVRLSGPQSLPVLVGLSGRTEFTPRMATRIRLAWPTSDDLLDDALAIYFPAPKSFTGEDIVELHLHGGRAVLQGVLAALSQHPNLRLAEPGEFTRRAFEAGKLDLTAAEGLADLVSAETAAQRAQALRQMQGELGRLYENWRGRLLRLLSHMEAEIDFPDEDLPHGLIRKINPKILELAQEISDHLADGRRGERLREGLAITILGPPNSGKSSLINSLAKRDAAIVSPIAGTTRDVIELSLDLGGWPVTLADTAGLHANTDDPIEMEGMRRAWARAELADLKLLILDAALWPTVPAEFRDIWDEDALLIWNKVDLHPLEPKSLKPNEFALSVKTGLGLSDFLKALEMAVAQRLSGDGRPTLTRLRHRQALEDCLGALQRFSQIHEEELAAEDLRLATRALGRITGRVSVEDMLDLIFSEFCIGK